MLLDTGATVFLLNLVTYTQFFPHEPLGPPTTTCGYANSEIDIVGSLQLPVMYGEKTLPAFRFNVAHRGTNLLGLDLFNGLGFTLLDTTGSEIHTVAIPWQQQWSALLMCRLPQGFHPPAPGRSDGDACHTAPPLLSPGELQRMLDGNNIEQVNASTWISNLVVANKKSKSLLRISVDLRAIISDKYPLPTTEELTRNSANLTSAMATSR